MATLSGQLQFNDYDQELIYAGFDAISPNRRARWINFGYRRVANRFPWLWESTSADVVLSPGDFAIGFADNANVAGPKDIVGFRTLDRLYIISPNYEQRLQPMSDDRFTFDWAPFDLSVSQKRGEPCWYHIADNKLYVLPPPQGSRTFRVKYKRRVTDLSNTTPGVTDTPITPQHLDEGILMAIFSHAHKRVHEIQLASVAEADLGDWFTQMLIDDDWQDEYYPERIQPDDTWA
jgi:hypothetical protein